MAAITSSSNGTGSNIIRGACWRIQRTCAASARLKTGVEQCRIQVTLATGIPESVCPQNQPWLPRSENIRPEDFAGREEEGILLVPKAGEMLYQLEQPPKWAGGN